MKRQATSSLLKFVLLISASGEYLLPRRSAVYIGHSPLAVLGWPVLCPDSCGITASPATTSAATGTARRAKRFMGYS